MRNVFEVLDTLKQQASNNPFVNTVTVGDPTQIDFDRDANYPVVHIVLSEATVTPQTVDFTVGIMAFDIVDHTKEDSSEDNYLSPHIDYILNTQLNVLIDVVTDFVRGGLRDLGLHTDENFVCTPFHERFSNIQAGWETEIVIKTPNKHSICE